MTPFVVQDLNGSVLYGGKADLSPGQTVVVTSSVGSTQHKVDPKTPLILITIPVQGEIEGFKPSEDPSEQIFLVETAESAEQRTLEEEENNRVDGTIKPQDYHLGPEVDTQEEVVGTTYVDPPEEDPGSETEPATPNQEQSEFELS